MKKKQGLNVLRPKLISVAVASCFITSSALANPTGHNVVHGNASVQQIGNLLKITNSPNAIINWQSFSIGANEITRFIQQSQASAVLNRVVGAGGSIDPSVILGALQSNGRVFLINPSGVLFGAGAQVDVAGLVTSSLNLSNADFLANRLNFAAMEGAGSVVNQGSITTEPGGDVYLIGPAVTNNGIITSPKGEVVLAAGNSVELVNPGTPGLRVRIAAPDNEAVNLGEVVARSGRVGIYAGLINNSGTIRADSAVAEGGRILLKAKQAVTLESTSILDASGAGGGTIEVLAKNGGTVNVAGRLDASAPKSGDGGFIETSADAVKVADGTVVTTSASHGKTGTWLVDPMDYVIAAYGGDITGAALSGQLGTTNVTLTSDEGAYGGPYGGNISVNDTVDWSSDNSLTLLARNDVVVNEAITNGGSGAIRMFAGWNGDANAPAVNSGTGGILLGAPVATNGNMFLIAGNSVSQNNSGAFLAANNLLVNGGAGAVFLSAAFNDVGTLAGRASGSFSFQNGRSLTIGTFAGTSGIRVNGPSSAQVYVYTSGNQAAAHLNVNQDIIANTEGSSNIYLNAGGSYGGTININNADVIANSGSSYSSYIDLYGRTVNINNSNISSSGYDASIYVYGNGPGGVNIDGSTLTAQAGPNGYAWIDVGTGVAGGSLTISNSAISANGRGASLFVESDGDITATNSTFAAKGETGADGAEGFVGFSAQGTINSGSSSVNAVGRRGLDGQPAALVIDGGEGGATGVELLANGDITLGHLSSNEQVLVFSNSGRIIDGNSGANVSAPFAYLAGYDGVGSIANPLETVTTHLFVAAYGGSIGVINAGNLVIEDFSNQGAGANAIATTGTMAMASSINVAGDLFLGGNNGMVVEEDISSGGNLVLSGGSADLAFDGVQVRGNNVTLSGNNVFVGFTESTGPTTVSARNLMKVTTAGNLHVLGGANSGANAVLSGTDVELTVGTTSGFVNVASGDAGAYAQIHAGSPTTISIDFPNLTSGGFFVNAVEGAITDGQNTGFFANGSPAVLGESLKITYGAAAGLPPAADQAINQIIASTNQQTTLTEEEKDALGITDNTTGVGDDKGDKKDLPVCN